MTPRTWMPRLLLAGLLSACHGNSTEPEPSDAGTTPTDAGTSTDAGTDAGVSYTGLVINEVVAAGDPDWFELYNSSLQTLDLSTVTFTDDRTTPAKAHFATGTTLAPGAFLRVDVSDTTAGFSLGSDEEVSIYTSTGKLIDLVDWNDGDSPKGKSYGRFPDATGAFKTLNIPTPGAANHDNGVCGNGTAEADEPCDGTDLHGATCTSQGYVSGTLACTSACQLDTSHCVAAVADTVINELTSSGNDSIELYNRGTATADLNGWYVADSSYDPSTGLPADKRYVLTTPLGAGEYLVLTKGTNHSFGIGNSASNLRLFNKDNQQVDIAAWTTGAAATSLCRIPNGTGDFTSCSTATFGAANQP